MDCVRGPISGQAIIADKNLPVTPSEHERSAQPCGAASYDQDIDIHAHPSG
jgi:hypothetical protein